MVWPVWGLIKKVENQRIQQYNNNFYANIELSKTNVVGYFSSALINTTSAIYKLLTSILVTGFMWTLQKIFIDDDSTFWSYCQQASLFDVCVCFSFLTHAQVRRNSHGGGREAHERKAFIYSGWYWSFIQVCRHIFCTFRWRITICLCVCFFSWHKAEW